MFRRRPRLTLPLMRAPPAPRLREARGCFAFLPRPACGGRVGVRGVCWGACFLLFCICVALSPGVRAADQPPALQPAPVAVGELELLGPTLQDDDARAQPVAGVRATLA